MRYPSFCGPVVNVMLIRFREVLLKSIHSSTGQLKTQETHTKTVKMGKAGVH